MSDAMNNPYANNPNQNGSNEQQPQGQPEYGAYAPNQQSQSQQQGGNPNNSGNPYQSEPQTPCYFDGPNANPNPNQNGFFYASYTTGQPYGQQNSQPGTGNDNWQPISPFKLAEEWLPKKAKNAIRGLYGIIGVAAIVLGWKQLLTLTLPVGTYQAIMVPAYLVFLVVAFVATLIAVRAKRFAALAAFPLVAPVAFGTIFGSSAVSAPEKPTRSIPYRSAMAARTLGERAR